MIFVGILFAGPLALAAATLLASDQTTGDPAKPIAELEHGDIYESSGLAASLRHPGVLWTHNDSGDQPRLFAFDEQGRHRGISTWLGVQAVDWEDMGSFRYRDRSYLFAADVGDNLRQRESVSIYLAEEPAQTNADVRAKTLAFQWQGGPRDCEAVAFDPTTTSFLLVEKKLSLASGLYSLPLPRTVAGPMPQAKSIGSIPAPLVTGMDISADGKRLAVTTYVSVLVYERKHQEESWPDAIRRGGKTLTAPPRRQGEAICFGVDAKSLYLTSEKRPCPLFRISLADALKDEE